MIAQCFEAKLTKKARDKKIAKQAIINVITMKTTFENSNLNVAKPIFVNQVYIVFDVKDKTNVCVKLLRIKMNLILICSNTWY